MKRLNAPVMAALMVVLLLALLAACAPETSPFRDGDIVTAPQPEPLIFSIWYSPDCVRDDTRGDLGIKFHLISKEGKTYHQSGYEELRVQLIMVKSGGDLATDSWSCLTKSWTRIEVHYDLGNGKTGSNVGWITNEKLEEVKY